ncbi:MAG: glycosyltransferase 87 family protein [Nitrososphaerota archaeon]
MATSMQEPGARAAAGQSEVTGNFLLAPRSHVVILAVAGSVLIFSALLHLQAVSSSTGAWSDIHAYGIQARTVFQHVNVYTATDRYPYPPVWVWIIALASWLSAHLGIPFDQMAKEPAIIGDYATSVLLLLFAWRRFGWCWFTLIPMALFALNPVVILISAGHGQFDSLVIGFVLLALYLRGERQQQRIVWAALALGVGIALKGYPVLALPYFVISAPRGSRLLTLAAAFVPLAASTILYCALFGISSHMLSNILLYQSTPDFGWGFLLARYTPDAFIAGLLSLASKVLIVLFGVVAPALLLRGRPIVAMIMLFSAFYALTYTMSVQYILWIVPFLCLALPLWSVVYSFAGLIAALSFYQRTGAGKGAIPTSHPWTSVASALNMPREVGVAAIIAVSAITYIALLILATPYAAALRARVPWWRAAPVARSQPDHAGAGYDAGNESSSGSDAISASE